MDGQPPGVEEDALCTQADGDSPKRARLHNHEEVLNDEDADHKLDQLLAQKERQEKAPSWAVALQASMDSSMLRMGELFSGVHGRLAVLEEERTRPDPRVDELSRKVDALTKLIEENQRPSPSAFASSGPCSSQAPPPQVDPWAGYKGGSNAKGKGKPTNVPAQDATPDTDYNHVVLGGWAFDTLHRVIKSDLDRVVGAFTDAERASISRQVVYGQRAWTAHLYLVEVDSLLARERFYALQAAHSNVYKTTSGCLIWLSPSRTPERRFRNKLTGMAGEVVLNLWPPALTKPAIEHNYNKQIVWVNGIRVAAISPGLLFAKKTSKLVSAQLADDSGEGQRFHYNVTALSEMTGIGEAEIEIKVHERVA